MSSPQVASTAGESSHAIRRGTEEEPSLKVREGKRIKLAEHEPLDEASSKPGSSKQPDASTRRNSRQGKDKSKKNAGRRSRRGTRPEGETETAEGGPKDGQPRLPKRLCALLIGYSGTGFNGMQIQPDVRTIEGVLFQALVKAGAVSEDNADDPVKVGLQRAARTDAGVHAAGNVVSMKIITSIPGVPDFVARVNEELPPEIRLWSFVRVQNSFNARTSCDSRKYTYFFPSYIMIPPKPGSGFHRNLTSQPHSPHKIPQATDAPSANLDARPDLDVHEFWRDQDPQSSREDDMRRKKQWRIGPEQMISLRDAAKKFEGTHNFHNFTVGKDFKDRTNQRYMKKIEIADPAVYGETEWICVMFHGQSFMLHQRKMMCVLVLTCRTRTPATVIDELYGPRTVTVPKMPSLGLLLEYPIFDSYNDRIDRTVNQGLIPSDPEYRPLIDFEASRAKIDGFKQEQIYTRMRTSEERSEVFDRWIRSIDSYAGSDLMYYNAKGTIPEASVIKKGEQRSNPFREIKRFDATDFTTDVLVDDAALVEELDEEKEIEHVDKKKLEEMEG